MRIVKDNVTPLEATRESIIELVNLFDGWDRFDLIIEIDYKNNSLTIKVKDSVKAV